MFLGYLSHFRRKNVNEAYDEINVFSNFKYNLVSRFNKLQDTATEQGSKEAFWGPGTPFETMIEALIHNLIDSFFFVMPQSNY